MKTKLSYLSILCAAALWGTMGIFVNQMTSFGFTSMQIIFWRALVAAVVLFGVLLIKDRSLLRIRLRDCPIFIGTGVISFTCFSFCYFTAMHLSSLSVAAVLLYTAPVFVMLLSALLFHEKLNVYKLLAIVLTVAGCALVTGIASGSAKVSGLGILFGLGAGVGYALYSIFGRYGVERYHTLTVTAYTFLFAAVASLPLSEPMNLFTKVTSPEVVFWILAVGIFTSALPYLLYTAGLTKVESGRAAVLATIEPVVAALIGVFVYGEQLDLYKVAGIVLVFAAVALIQAKSR